jgi:hypothetical protein
MYQYQIHQIFKDFVELSLILSMFREKSKTISTSFEQKTKSKISWCNPCLNDHFKKNCFRIGVFWAFLRAFGWCLPKIFLVSQKAPLFRNCKGAKFGDFAKMLLGKMLQLFIRSADFLEI